MYPAEQPPLASGSIGLIWARLPQRRRLSASSSSPTHWNVMSHRIPDSVRNVAAGAHERPCVLTAAIRTP